MGWVGSGHTKWTRGQLCVITQLQAGCVKVRSQRSLRTSSHYCNKTIRAILSMLVYREDRRHHAMSVNSVRESQLLNQHPTAPETRRPSIIITATKQLQTAPPRPAPTGDPPSSLDRTCSRVGRGPGGPSTGWLGLKNSILFVGSEKLFYEVGWVRLGRKIPTFSGSGWIKIQTTAYWSWFWVRRSQLRWVELRYIGFGLESYNFWGLDGFAWVILQLSWIVLGWVRLGWIRKSLQLFCARNFRDVGSVSIFLENVCINVCPFLRFFPDNSPENARICMFSIASEQQKHRICRKKTIWKRKP